LVNSTTKQLVEKIYYGHQIARNDSVIHYGDDTTGFNKQHESDNEVIFIDLNKMDNGVDRILIYVDSYSGYKLSKVPNLKVRVYSGKPGRINEVLCSYEVTSDSSSSYSMHIGEIYKTIAGEWEFKAVGEYRKENRLDQILQYVLSTLDKPVDSKNELAEMWNRIFYGWINPFFKRMAS
jgi:stress response protein SCP2